MMSDSSDEAVPKLADFGLAKIMGITQEAIEPFGTLGFAAPEVLKKEPYGFSCDLWSVGCLTYGLLSGTLPFDKHDPKLTIQATLNDTVVFPPKHWVNISFDA